MTAVALATPAALSAQARVQAESSASVRAESRGEARRSDTERAEARQNARAEAVLNATVAAGLPGEPVRRVMAEGEAKGASDAEIAKAAAAVQARLRVAHDALAGDASEGQRAPYSLEIAAGAEALAAGARPEHLKRLRREAPEGRSLEASLSALAELRGRGLDASAATGALAARLAGGASDAAITAFAGSITSNAQLGAVASPGVGSSLGGNAGVGAGVSGTLGGVSGALGGGVTGSVRGVLP